MHAGKKASAVTGEGPFSKSQIVAILDHTHTHTHTKSSGMIETERPHLSPNK